MKYKIFILFFIYVCSLIAEKEIPAFSILRLTGSGRSGYLADTSGGEPWSLDGLCQNPVTGAMLTSIQLQFSHGFWYDTFNYEEISGIFPVKTLNISLLFKHFYTPPFTWIGPEGESLGELSYSDTFLSLGMNKSIKNFFYGVATKIIYSHLQDSNGATLSIDLGTGVITGSKQNPFSISFAVKNIGPSLKYNKNSISSLPLDINFSFLFSLYNNREQNLKINLSGCGDYIFISEKFIPSFGIEMLFDRYLRLGCGYKFLKDTGNFSIGGGLLLPVKNNRLSIDIAYIPEKRINDIFILTAGWSLSSEEEKESKIKDTVKPKIKSNITEPSKDISKKEEQILTNNSFLQKEGKSIIFLADFEFNRVSFEERKNFISILQNVLKTENYEFKTLNQFEKKIPYFDPSYCREESCAVNYMKKTGIDIIITGMVEKDFGEWKVNVDIFSKKERNNTSSVPTRMSQEFNKDSLQELEDALKLYFRNNYNLLMNLKNN